MNELCCDNDDFDIYDNELWIIDCEDIPRCYAINFCPLCGKDFKKLQDDKK